MNSTILKSNYKIKPMPKFYDMENMTQEHLNEIVLERNTFAKEIERLSKEVDMWNKKYNEQFDIINALEKWLEEQITICQAHDNQLGVNVCNTFKNKLSQLKGDSGNDK